jgi:hypothetical protein
MIHLALVSHLSADLPNSPCGFTLFENSEKPLFDVELLFLLINAIDIQYFLLQPLFSKPY